jgi:GT2 family glycosyltransferase
MNNNKLNLTIIIISYNVNNYLLNCLDKIIYKKNTEFIIIDNNSKDGSYSSIKQKYHNKKNVNIIKNKKNVGFAKAVNQGLKIALGQKVLLLNPDTIPSIQAIKKLELFIDKTKKAGLVGGKMIHAVNKTVNGTCVDKPTFLIGLFEFTNLKKIFKNNIFSKKFYYKDCFVNKPKIVYGLSGGFLMFKKSLINKIGYFDNNYFMYLEDVDFGIRFRKAGYKNYYLPNAKIRHNSGSSSKHNKYRINVNAWKNSRNYFFKKHSNTYEWFFLNLAFMFDNLIINFKHKLFNEPLI